MVIIKYKSCSNSECYIINYIFNHRVINESYYMSHIPNVALINSHNGYCFYYV